MKFKAKLMALMLCFCVLCPSMTITANAYDSYNNEVEISPRIMYTKTKNISTTNDVYITCSYTYHDETGHIAGVQSYSVYKVPDGYEVTRINYDNYDSYLLFTVVIREKNTTNYISGVGKLYA